jgi:hypothetical protein
MLPDQTATLNHLLVGIGKEGVVYLVRGSPYLATVWHRTYSDQWNHSGNGVRCSPVRNMICRKLLCVSQAINRAHEC